MSCNKKSCENKRLGTVGGQAVLEGVMMQSKKRIALAVRNIETKEINVRSNNYKAFKDKHKWANIPILRGIINFVETLIMSFSTLTASTEMLGIEDEEPGKFEKWLNKVFGKSLMSFISFVSVILGVVLALGLFMFLPMWTVGMLKDWLKFNDVIRSLLEGFMRIIIFILYIVLTSLLKDIRRTYQYHGAEHKSIFCYEKGLELTVNNVRKQSRFHPRCGTAFIFVVLIISILCTATIYSFITFPNDVVRFLIKLPVVPLLVGISYEFIMFAGKHDNACTRILSAPGLWMQRLTTKEPDDGMMEVAITALKTSLIEEFPEFQVPFEDGYDINGKIKTEEENKEADGETK